MSFLGDSGRGFELARRLESFGVWRSWLGDSLYAAFVHFLTSPSSWEAFMRTEDSKSRAQIQLQLRARALLFDKASISFFLGSDASSSSASDLYVLKLNPACELSVFVVVLDLQLRGDDVYYTLDSSSKDGAQLRDSGVASNSAAFKSQNVVQLVR